MGLLRRHDGWAHLLAVTAPMAAVALWDLERKGFDPAAWEGLHYLYLGVPALLVVVAAGPQPAEHPGSAVGDRMCAVPPGYGAGSAASRWRHGRPEGVSVASTVVSRPESGSAPTTARGRVSRLADAVRPGLRRTALLALGCNAVLELVQILGVDGYPWRFKTPTYAAMFVLDTLVVWAVVAVLHAVVGPVRGDLRAGLDGDRGARVREPREGAVPARAALPRRLAVRL